MLGFRDSPVASKKVGVFIRSLNPPILILLAKFIFVYKMGSGGAEVRRCGGVEG